MATAGRIALRAGIGVLATGVAGVAVLAAEGFLATRREYVSATSAPPVSGVRGAGAGTPLRLAVLGDSTAAGLGVTSPEDTVGAQVADALARDLGRPVRVDGLGVSGARSADLAPQVSRALLNRPDVAVVLIGPNDATHLTGLDDVRRDVERAVRQLQDAGTTVVVGSCADMGAATAFLQPLRTVVAWRGRAVGAAARGAAAEAGAAVVDIGAETGPAFRRDPVRYLSEDEFHPSAEGYRLWAEALLPAVRSAATRVAAG